MPHTFKDKDGKEWPVVVDVTAVRDVRKILGVDLLTLADGEDVADSLIIRVLAEPVLLVDILFVLCREAAEAADISDRDFGRRMGGDCLDQAADALLAEIVDFFPNARDRQRAKKVLATVSKILENAQDQLDAKLDDEAIQKATSETLLSPGK
jgi:hypothetical protein